MKVICLNGAPRSGKDTVAEILKDMDSNVRIMKFAKPLDDIAKSILNVSDEQYSILREDKKDDFLKGTKSTMRDLLIGISEGLIKPIFGKEYFAEVAAKKIEDHIQKYKIIRTEPINDIFVISDCGFQYEYDYFKKRLKDLGVVAELVQIQRNGTSFKGDSREYVTDSKQHTLLNNGTLEDLKKKSEWILSDSCCGYCHEHPDKECTS